MLTESQLYGEMLPITRPIIHLDMMGTFKIVLSTIYLQSQSYFGYFDHAEWSWQLDHSALLEASFDCAKRYLWPF